MDKIIYGGKNFYYDEIDTKLEDDGFYDLQEYLDYHHDGGADYDEIMVDNIIDYYEEESENFIIKSFTHDTEDCRIDALFHTPTNILLYVTGSCD